MTKLTLLLQEYDCALLQIVVDNARSPKVSFTESAEQLPALHPWQRTKKAKSVRGRDCASPRQSTSRWISENAESSSKPLRCPIRRRSEPHEQQNQHIQARHYNDNPAVCGKVVRDSKPSMPSRWFEIMTMGSPSSVTDAGAICIPRGA